MSKDKGVSEIIATVLMIMIVTVLGFSIFLYGLGFFTATTSAYNQANSKGIQSLQESFTIVDANFTPIAGGTNVTVYVYNYGSTNLNIVAMYMDNGTLTLSNPVTITPDLILPVTGSIGSSVNLTVQHTIRVVSSLGNYYENYFM